MAATALLELKGLQVAYGGIQAVKGIDLEVAEGELVCLIGANGAGKTTTLKGITGLQPVKSGSIHYDGEDITGKPAFELVRKGLSMVPEGRGVFGALTIEENLAMGAYTRNDKRRDRPRRRARVHAVSAPARNGAGRPPARSRAASSRCWRWVAR